eukprot:scaffold51311_cov16-Tisochrysis_lutea.AAC.1
MHCSRGPGIRPTPPLVTLLPAPELSSVAAKGGLQAAQSAGAGGGGGSFASLQQPLQRQQERGLGGQHAGR